MKKQDVQNKLNLLRRVGQKAVALLLDPDKCKDDNQFRALVRKAVHHEVDFFFVGGSLVSDINLADLIREIKKIDCETPVLLFPGNVVQLTDEADGILFLSLISGRNPEYLIGQQVTAAPLLAKTELEVVPTGYLLINDGQITSVNYVSQTLPIPNGKPDLAVATALAGKYLGLRTMYLEAGSGAKNPVQEETIRQVSERVGLPMIVGGGINSLERAKSAWQAGADVVVLGNGAEKNPNLLIEVLEYAKVYNLTLNVN